MLALHSYVVIALQQEFNARRKAAMWSQHRVSATAAEGPGASSKPGKTKQKDSYIGPEEASKIPRGEKGKFVLASVLQAASSRRVALGLIRAKQRENTSIAPSSARTRLRLLYRAAAVQILQ
jgi:hypothetical protein